MNTQTTTAVRRPTREPRIASNHSEVLVRRTPTREPRIVSNHTELLLG
jgi:hypothetical protein